MIVIDSAVLVTALVSPPPVGAAVARRIADESLVAPEVIDVEAIMAIRRLEQAGQLTTVAACRVIDALDGFPVRRMSQRGLQNRMWQLRDVIEADEAAYVALAEKLGLTLLTGHKRLRRIEGLRCCVEVIG